MKISGLVQAPFNTTMMGVMRGALNYYGLPVTDAFLYGASGHAFVINIHAQLCPSGPYVWGRGPVDALLGNLGLRSVSLGFFHGESSRADRARVEARLRESLERGTPCALINMENQLITGYDETGFLTTQPWPGHDFPPAHLSFGDWRELGAEIHLDFSILERAEAVDRRDAVRASLRYAVSLWRNPPPAPRRDYAMGAAAYPGWQAAVRAGHGASHGNWWNATVWAECRAQAVDYCREIAPLLPSPAAALATAAEYSAIADLLGRAANKELSADDKVCLLNAAAPREDACIRSLEEQLAGMG